MAFEIDDRVAVNENSHWPAAIGRHGLVRSNNDPDSGFPPNRPVEVHLDNEGGNTYFAEEALDYEVN